MNNHANKRLAFTLVEIVVVVGIISIMTAILLPALSRARLAARELGCMSNLRQLHLTAEQQLVRPGGTYLPAPDVDPDSSWINAMGLTGPEAPSVAVCPAVSGFATLDPAGKPSYLLVGEGSAELGWNESFDDIGRRGTYGWNSATGGIRPASIRRSGEVPLLADSARSVGTVNQNLLLPDTEAGSEQRYTAYAGYWINRHRGGINVIFVDGHVERVMTAQIKELRWNAN